MKIVEPSAVLLETGDACVFIRAAGGPASPPIAGILEDAIAERDTGDTTRAAAAWQLTCATPAVATFGEDDLVTVGRASFMILDRVAADPSFTVFLLTQDY